MLYLVDGLKSVLSLLQSETAKVFPSWFNKLGLIATGKMNISVFNLSTR